MPSWMRRFLWQDGGDASGGGGGGAAVSDGASAAGGSAAAADGGGDAGGGARPTAAPKLDDIVAQEIAKAGPAEEPRPRAQRGAGGRFAPRGGDAAVDAAANPAAGAGAANPAAAPVAAAPAGGADAATAKWLADNGVQLPEGAPPEVGQAVAELGQRWLREVYAPVAREVAQHHEQVEAQREQLTAFVETPQYKLAEALHADPALYQRVNEALQGGPPPGLEGLDPNQLDDAGRALYAANARLTQELTGLRAGYSELQQATAELRQWVATRDEADQQAEQSQTQQATRRDLDSAIGAASTRYGFDVRSFKPQFDKAVAYVSRAVKAANYDAARQPGGRGVRPAIDLAALFGEAFEFAGFGALAQKRQQQAATAARAPSGAAPQRRRVARSLDDIVAEEIAAADGA